MLKKIKEPVEVHAAYDVAPEVIFDAWIIPALIRKWLFVGPTSEIVNVVSDLKTGGEFSILELERTNKEYSDHFGRYQLIDRPTQLVFTLSVPKHFSGETTVRIDIKKTASGCELTLTQTGVSKNKTARSWKDMLKQLKKVVS